VDRSYIHDNDRERQRLEALVARLSDQDLARPLPAGWTVAAALAHLAFWDQRIVVLAEAWRRAGAAAPPPAHDPANTDWINDAAKPLLLGLPHRTATELAVAAARAADRAAAELPDAFLAANAAAGNPLNLLRATHRSQHLDEIERALGR
jgi:hypothetical protein